MIPKTCPLNDKYKLKVTLHGKCCIQGWPSCDCDKCPLGENSRKELGVLEKIQEILKKNKLELDLLRAEELMQKLRRKQGLSS